MSNLAFFIGKGGVGKTTLAASYAVWSATRQPAENVLLVSTDPAHSIADVLQIRLADRPKRISLPGRGSLSAWQIDAPKQFCKFLDKYREHILDLVESGTIFSREEIGPLLDTTLPGMAEIAALLAIEEVLAGGRYARIVVDTAPIGHTLRLFELPEAFRRFLDFLDLAGSRDRVLAETFGSGGIVSQPFLADWRRMVASVEEALTQKHSRLVLVTTPERFALNESMRAAEALERSAARLRITDIVLNRAVPRVGRCPACNRRARATQSAMVYLKRNFPGPGVKIGEDPGAPILGVRALRDFAAHVFGGKRLPPAAKPPRARDVRLEASGWPTLDVPLSLTLGKGGVGKTTVSAALAYHERQSEPSRAVTLCSTDPAPSLDDVFRQEIGDRAVPVLGDRKFSAMEIDSVAHFRAWAEGVRNRIDRALSGETKGIHVDLSFDRRVFSALLDIVPPGVDEVFAIFRIVDLLQDGRARVVIDMAPTGHALELLRMPQRMLLWSRLLLKSLAAHRTLPLAQDVAVDIAEVSQQVRQLAKILADARRARVWPVMLAEPLPDRETGRLLEALRDLKAPVAPLVVNRVLFDADAGGCARCSNRRAWQMATLAGLARRYGRIYVAREFPREVAGPGALGRFTRHLWQTGTTRNARRG